jgi:tagaturonate reductase
MPPEFSEITTLQFGTGRFLQAHVDLLLAEAAKSGQVIGKVCILQSSNQAAGRARAEAFNSQPTYQVKIEGFRDGVVVDEMREVSIIDRALVLNETDQWQQALDLVKGPVRTIISNTADHGYELCAKDRPDTSPPASFPAKLLLLLRERFQAGGSPLIILPCELISGNATLLRKIVLELGNAWGLAEDVLTWIGHDCIWASTLVDRIVSESLLPLGAVAEPYALWVIQEMPGLVPPCSHPDVKVVKDLFPYEMLKLGVLNLSHTFLVDLWLRDNKPEDLTLVSEIIKHQRYQTALNVLLTNEVLPVLKRLLPGEDPEAYMHTVYERFANPFLKHQLADIAQNHAEKVNRRILMIRNHSHRLFPNRNTPLLDSCLQIAIS